MSAIDALLAQVNADRRSLFEALPENTYIELHEIKNLVPSKKSPLLVLFKFMRPLAGLEVTISTSQSLTLGKLHYLCTGPIHFAYVFEFPCFRVIKGTNYYGVSRKDLDPADYDAVSLLSNNHFHVFVSGDDALLVVDGREAWVDRSGYHGGKQGK